jgi:hypothetical protein
MQDGQEIIVILQLVQEIVMPIMESALRENVLVALIIQEMNAKLRDV